MQVFEIFRLFRIINSGFKLFEDLYFYFVSRFKIVENLFYEQMNYLKGEWYLKFIRIKFRDWQSYDFNNFYES